MKEYFLLESHSKTSQDHSTFSTRLKDKNKKKGTTKKRHYV